LDGTLGGLPSKLFLTAGSTKNLDQVVLCFMKSDLGNLQDWRLDNDSAKLAPVFNHGHNVKFFPCQNLPFLFVVIASQLPGMYSCEKPVSISLPPAP